MLRYLISISFLPALTAMYLLAWPWVMGLWKVVRILTETALRAGELVNGLLQVLRSLSDGLWRLPALPTGILFGE
jgi:hypothetical protein